MTEGQIARLGPAFTAFLACFRDCFASRPTFGHLGTYCRGLLSDLHGRASSRSPWPPAPPSARSRSSSPATSGTSGGCATRSNAASPASTCPPRAARPDP